MGCGIVRDMVISEEAEYRLFSDDIESVSKQRVEAVDARFTLSTTISDTGKNNSTLGKIQGRIGVCFYAYYTPPFNKLNYIIFELFYVQYIEFYFFLLLFYTEIVSRKENP